MSKILILAESSFGKSSSIGPISREDFERAGFPDTEIRGVNPKETFIVSVSNKGLPIPRWKTFYKTCDLDKAPTIENGNHAISNNGKVVTDLIGYVNRQRPDIKNIILDDANYLMQDQYMSKVWAGYDIFKILGAMMGGIFNEMERISGVNKNFIMMAHHEEFKNSNFDTLSYRFKTVGKMVQDYITPEGKFEIVLFGRQTIIDDGKGSKRIAKQFVTNFDGQYPAKSPIGMFPSLYIPNDLGYVIDCVNEYNG